MDPRDWIFALILVVIFFFVGGGVGRSQVKKEAVTDGFIEKDGKVYLVVPAEVVEKRGE